MTGEDIALIVMAIAAFWLFLIAAWLGIQADQWRKLAWMLRDDLEACFHAGISYENGQWVNTKARDAEC